jgi:hypothetical protein
MEKLSSFITIKNKMVTCGDCSNVIWELSILGEFEDGFLCMSPNGDTQFLSRSEYDLYLKNKSQRHGNGNFYTDSESEG